jgi:hypothetical protein
MFSEGPKYYYINYAKEHDIKIPDLITYAFIEINKGLLLYLNKF